MKRPEPVWETDYKSGRRKHSHRCFCCRKVIKPGERVLMCIYPGPKTRACHIDHADKPYADQDGISVRDVMRHWGLDALKLKGFLVKDDEYPQKEIAA